MRIGLPHDDDSARGASFERLTERAPVAFAVTRGSAHALVYANSTFGRLTGAVARDCLGKPIADALVGRATDGMVELLDEAWRSGVSTHCDLAALPESGSVALRLAAWPVFDHLHRVEHLVVEAREASQAELSLETQREIAERLLLSALREHEAAESAEAAHRRASFLADVGRRLAESLDEAATLCVVAGLALPSRGTWCFVDLVEPGDTMRRAAIMHPDPDKQVLVHGLANQWSPQLGDAFGLPAVLHTVHPVIVDDLEAELIERGGGPEIVDTVRQLDVGAVLTVPLVVAGRVLGAITFVGARLDPQPSSEDTELARELAVRCATALDRARLYGQALLLKTQAEAASRATTAFLGTMSHELRTPLNAIGGFIDLMQMGLRGSVTDEQRADLDRMKRNQRHLLKLIEEVLGLVSVGSGRREYRRDDLLLSEVVGGAVALVESLLTVKGISYASAVCDPGIMVRADREKLQQVLLNLLSNAVKFTPSGGTIAIECECAGDDAVVRVIDTGAGIPPERLEDIFEPFVQANSDLTKQNEGVGLGLAISRDLARAMKGELTAESAPGRGSRFTLKLPRASDRRAVRRQA